MILFTFSNLAVEIALMISTLELYQTVLRLLIYALLLDYLLNLEVFYHLVLQDYEHRVFVDEVEVSFGSLSLFCVEEFVNEDQEQLIGFKV